MKTKAFLSYCRQDSAKVNVLERYLRNLGLVVLRDNYDISVNDDIEFTIQKIVNSQCDLVVVALTNNSLASPWVKKELEFAERARASGRPVEIIYVKLQAGTFVPESVQKRLFVDLALPDKDGKQDSLLRLAKYLLGRPPWIATGVYNVYTDVDDLNSRREDTDSDISCGINEFLTLAQHKITSIGLWFGAIFGMDQGAALVEVLRSSPFVEIDLYLPDPNHAPRE
jgi:TIR domain